MRRVTLADRAVRARLGKRFVLVHENLEGDEAAGSSFAHRPSAPPGTCLRGNGEHNLQTIMLTPDGRLLHLVAGYLEPADLAKELDFAFDLHQRVVKAERDLEQGEELDLAPLKREHRKRIDALRKPDADAPFARFEVDRQRKDHGFAMRRLLSPGKEFRIKDLLGNARTFFGTSGGQTPKGRIGDEKNEPPKRGGSTGPRGN